MGHYFKWAKSIALTTFLFLLFWFARFLIYSGPTHDEAISLLAARGMEGEYSRLVLKGAYPFKKIVSASEWQKFTHHFAPVPFHNIRKDLAENDLHPPLAFWIYNRWLSLSDHNILKSAIILSGLQILLAGILVQMTTFTITQNWGIATWGGLIFLLSNAALQTSVYIRQYALLALLGSLCLYFVVQLISPRKFSMRFVIHAILLATVCLGGMMTQNVFAVWTLPLQLTLLLFIVFKKEWRKLAILLVAFGFSGLIWLYLMPGIPKEAIWEASSAELHLIRHGALPDPSERLQSVSPTSNPVIAHGLARLFLPLPSFLPQSFDVLAFVVLYGMLLVAGILLYRNPAFPLPGKLIAIGFVGPAILQVVLVKLRILPGWASAAPYITFLPILFAVGIALLGTVYRKKWTGLAIMTLIGAMILGQTGHVLHRLKSNATQQYNYFERFNPPLVLIDNIRRGHVLKWTIQMNPQQKVLVVPPEVLIEVVKSGELSKYRPILYLMDDEKSLKRSSSVLGAFSQQGWSIRQLPTLHPRVQDAYLLTPG